MNDSEAYMNSIANTFNKEPVFNCPQCNAKLFTDWVDNGFGPYSVQASPYGCECGWHETGCKECIKERCFSWSKCQGHALIVNPASKEGVTNTMNNLDPNTPQAAEGQEQATEQQNAQESASQDQAMEATQDNEEGSTEG
jgi:hypothetical protein